MSEKSERDKNYERIGRSLEAVVASGYANKRRLIAVSFIRGIATGLGSVIGATIIFVIFIWLLSLFSDIPLIGDVFENARQTIQKAPGN